MDKLISAFITFNGTPQIGLTPKPTISVYNAISNNILVNAVSMEEVGGGFYKYTMTNYDDSIEYLFITDAGNTFPDQERYYYGDLSGIDEIDASRISKNVWNYPSNVIFNPDTFGELLQSFNNSMALSIEVLNLLVKYQENRTKVDAGSKTLTVYDDDQVTPLKVFKLYDQNGILSVDNVYERIPQ